MISLKSVNFFRCIYIPLLEVTFFMHMNMQYLRKRWNYYLSLSYWNEWDNKSGSWNDKLDVEV